MRLSLRNSFQILAIPAFCLLLTGCCSALGPTIKVIEQMKSQYVNVVLVSSDGKTFPKELYIGKEYAVIWIADAEELTISFDDSAVKANCVKNICSLVATNLTYQTSYPYTGTVTCKSRHEGKPQPLDPRLEVVR